MNVQVLDLFSDAEIHSAGRCRLCGGGLEQTFVNLGMSPLCESYLKAEQLDAMELFFRSTRSFAGPAFSFSCESMSVPKSIFREYAYFSSYSTTWVAHAKAYCETMKAMLGLGPESSVVEVASNDGYLLQHFLPLGVPVLGIEPAANVAKVAIDKGIPTRVDFFGAKLAETLATEGKRADLIIGNNVLAQVSDLNDFVSGMVRLLKPEGVITLEFPHLKRLMAENQFDTIYHEHFSYFSLITIDRLATRHDLKLIDMEELPTHGGSLRVYLAHASSIRPTMKSVSDLLAREHGRGLCDVGTYASFAGKVERTKRSLLSFLIAVKDAGKVVCGYGAPGKGNTLLNYCGIGTGFLDFTVDRNPYKHGRFTPGRHIPIQPVGTIDAVKPDYILILPWNLKDEIIQQMCHVAAWGGRFIDPIPDLAVVDPKELQP